MDSALDAANGVMMRLDQEAQTVTDEFAASTGGRFQFASVYGEFLGGSTAVNHCSPLVLELAWSGKHKSFNLGCSEGDSWIALRDSETVGICSDCTLTMGVHPNAEGHRCLAEVVWNESKQYLGSGEPHEISVCN